MARVTLEQAQEQTNSGGNSEWLKLENDGDIATVQFLAKDETELETFIAHRVKIDGYDRMVNCIREYGDQMDCCPLCASGLKTETAIILTMLDHKDDKVKIWQRGGSYIKKMQGMLNRYNPLNQEVFEVERSGKKGDMKTTYEFYPTKNEPKDLSSIERPQILGRVIADWSADDMETYLQTGENPKKSNDNQQQEEQPRRRMSEERNTNDDMPRRRRV